MFEQTVRVVSESDLNQAISPYDAIRAINEALLVGSAPGLTPLRTINPTSSGEILLMQSEVGGDVGVKVLSVGHGDRTDVPRVQGYFLMFDGDSLSPVALIDAVGLTNFRTAAVSAVAADHLATPDAGCLVVFGTGPQAWSHVQSLSAVRTLSRVIVVGRSPDKVRQLIDRCATAGIDAEAGHAESVRSADLVACCTSSASPLFDSGLLRNEACVIAMGSHHPNRREVDAELVRRGSVVVENKRSALAEAGDILLAIADGVDPARAIDAELADLVQGKFTPAAGRPRLFKSVGEAWADVAVASAVLDRL